MLQRRMKKSEQLLQNEQKITEIEKKINELRSEISKMRLENLLISRDIVSVEISLRSENHILSTNVFYLKETNGLNFFKNFSDKIFNKLNGKPI